MRAKLGACPPLIDLAGKGRFELEREAARSSRAGSSVGGACPLAGIAGQVTGRHHRSSVGVGPGVTSPKSWSSGM